MRSLTLLLLLVFSFTGCYQGGDEIPYQPPSPNKWPPYEEGNIIRVALYIDTDKPESEVRAALQSAGGYMVLPDSDHNRGRGEVQYFDYVIISGGLMKFGTVTPYVAFSANFLSLMKQYNDLIRPLRSRGIKVLLGIKGAGEGIAMGCLPRDESVKNQGSVFQWSFARFITDSCAYYGFDGVELWDTNGKGQGRNPYPDRYGEGENFFNGLEFIDLPTENSAITYWNKGGGFMIDMMAYALEMFGAQSTDQGDHAEDQKIFTPILLRDEGYGSWIPPMVPRYEFSSSTASVTGVVQPIPKQFGFVVDVRDGKAKPSLPLQQIVTWEYAPIIFDLANMDKDEVVKYSRMVGGTWLGEFDENGDPIYELEGDPGYALVYYTGLGEHTYEQLDLLSITSQAVFGADVTYNK